MTESRSRLSLSAPRVVFPAVGALQGLAIYCLADVAPARDYGVGLLLAAFLAPWLGLLAWRPGRAGEAALAGLGFALLAGGLGAWAGLRFGPADNGLRVTLFAAAGSIAGVAYAFLQRRHGEPEQAPEDATRLLVALKTLAIGWLFAGILYAVLQLWIGLFKLIGIVAFERVFEAQAFVYPALFGTAALGIAVVHEWPAVRRAVRWLLAALVRLLAPILALAVVVFAAALPFTGLSTLWATGHATSLLLAIQLTALVFAHLVAEAAGRGETTARPLGWLIAVELLLLPVLAALALYALYVRIGQHGPTMERLVALVAASLTAAAALWAALATLIGRFAWTPWLARANPALLALAGLAAAALLTPLLDPWGLAAKAQYARLAGDAVAAEAFDFGYLKFELGRQGKAALARIRANPALADKPEIARRLTLLDRSGYYGDWKLAAKSPEAQARILGGLGSFVSLTPADMAVPEALERLVFDRYGALLEACDAPGRCHLLALNMDGDDEVEFVLLVADRYGGVVLFDRRGAGWRGIARGEEYFQETDAPALRAGAVATATPTYKDLLIGGRRFGFTED